MPKLTAESFLSVLRQSGLIDKEQLKRLTDEMQQIGVNVQDSDAICGFLIQREVITQWQADKLQQGKHKGFTLGKYRLLSLLGKGGMSSVYLAEHVLMRRRCAIKVLPIKRVKDSSYLARFHREAQAVASLDHPNIVRAYDIDHEIDKDTEIHFLVMEYVNGRSIQEVVKEDGQLSVEDTAEYIRQAAHGLEHAHKAGLVHRDVKPGNLLVDTNGVVKLLDLGLARFATTDEENPLTVTHDEKVLGTADYLSPEQALDSHLVDARADIYSLGCTIYYCLTGHPPFVEGTLAQRLMWHQTKDPPPVTNERPDVPASFTSILTRMMAKKADDRFQTMADVAQALANWLELYARPEWRATHPQASQAGTSSGSNNNLRRAAEAANAAASAAAPASHASVVAPAIASMALSNVSDPPTELDQSGMSQFFQQLQHAPPSVAVAAPVATAAAFVPPIASAVAPVTSSSPVPTAAPVVAAPIAPPVYVQQPIPAQASVPQWSAPVAAVAIAPPPPTASAPRMPWEQDDAHDEPAAESRVSEGSANVFDHFSPSAGEQPSGGLAETLSFATASSAAGSAPMPAPFTSAAPTSVAPTAPVMAVPIGVPSAASAQPIAMPVAAPIHSTVPQAQPAYAVTATVPTSPAHAMPITATPVAVAPPAPMKATHPQSLPATPVVAQAYAAPTTAPQAAFIPPQPSFDQAASFPWGDGEDETGGDEYPSFGPSGSVDATSWNQPQTAAPLAAAPVAAYPVAQPMPGQPYPQQPQYLGQPTPGYPPGYAQPVPVTGTPTPQTIGEKKPIPMKVLVGAVGGLAAIVIGAGAFFALSGGADPKKPDKPLTNIPKATDGGTTKASENQPPKKKDPAVAGAPEREKEKPKPAPEPLKPINGKTIDVGPDGHFHEIWEALSYVRKNRGKYQARVSSKPNITINVTGGQTYEPIIVDNSDGEYPTGIHIVAKGSKAKLKQRESDGFALRVLNCEGLRVENFEIDAGGKDKAIEIVGYCTLATFSKLSISGFTKAGFFGSGLSGKPSSQVQIEECEFRPGNDASVGIVLEQGLAESTKFLIVERCWLLGPMKSGIEISGAARNVELRENIFDRNEVGIRLVKTKEAIMFLIANNTFHATQQDAIHFAEMPKGRSGDWVFHRNVFVKGAGPDLRIEKGFDQGVFDSYLIKKGGTGIESNFSDRSAAANADSGERELVIEPNNKGKPIALISADPKSPDFLGIAKNSPLANVPNPAFGTKPYAGAKAPK